MVDPVVREHEVTGILDRWDWEDGACLIGGYAVAAYAKPRYSRDLDFVIPKDRREATIGRLLGLGFEQRGPRRGERTDGFPDAVRMEKANLTIDLMVGSVRDRETGTTIPQEWIAARARAVRVLLITGSTERPVQVCRPEALWVLKLVAGRDQDLGDLFALSRERVDIEEIRDYLVQIKNDSLARKLRREAARLRSDKIYLDSCASRFLRSSTEESRIEWDRFVRLFQSILS